MREGYGFDMRSGCAGLDFLTLRCAIEHLPATRKHPAAMIPAAQIRATSSCPRAARLGRIVGRAAFSGAPAYDLAKPGSTRY
ncbi:hypothetical protein FB451DRAFT_1408421 [Mycena latifolia]|nr:hypothetical protein FB451DRAFT_1408421 [Mycena latifolia]